MHLYWKATNSSVYRFLVYKLDITDIHANTIIESRSVTFFEHIYLCKESYDHNSHKRQRKNIAIESHANSDESPQHDKVEPRHSKQQKTSNSFGLEVLTIMVQDEPRTYKEAIMFYFIFFLKLF